MNLCYSYSRTCQYEFDHSKSSVVTYGETNSVHSEEMKEREWMLGDDTVDELCEYNNLGVQNNYIGSFSSSVKDSIGKTRSRDDLFIKF